MYGLWADPTVKHHHENAKNKKVPYFYQIRNIFGEFCLRFCVIKNTSESLIELYNL